MAQQAAQGWGDGVLPQLAKDLQAAFPSVSGFSRTNLYRIRAFYLAYRTSSEHEREIERRLLEYICLFLHQKPFGHLTERLLIRMSRGLGH